MLAFTNNTILLELGLADEAVGLYPVASIFDAAHSLIASVTLTDHSDGLYSGSVSNLNVGYYTVQYLTYSNITHTTRSDHEMAVESLTVEDPAQLLDLDLSSHLAKGTVGEALLSAFAQAGGHVRDDTISFDSNNRPTAFRRRVFATALDANNSTAGATGENEIMTFIIEASHISADKWQSLLRKRIS